MKSIQPLILLGLLTLTTPAGALPVPAPPEKIPVPGGSVLRYQLASGTTVVLQNVPGLPVAAVSLVVSAGNSNDPVNLPGLCAVTAQIMSRQTPRNTSFSLLTDYEKIGARFGHRVLHDRTVFWEVVPRQHLDWAAELELERLKGTTPPSDELSADFASVEHEWSERNASGSSEVLAKLFPGSRNVPPIRPTLSEVDAFRIQNFRPQDAVLTVVGSFDPAKLARLLPGSPFQGISSSAPRLATGMLKPTAVERPGARGLNWFWPLPQLPKNEAAIELLTANPPAYCTLTIDYTEGLVRLRRLLRSNEDVATVESDLRQEWSTRMLRPILNLQPLRAAATLLSYRELDDLGQRAIALGLDQSRDALLEVSEREPQLRELNADDLAQAAQATLRMDQAVELRPGPGRLSTQALAPPEASEVLKRSTPRTAALDPNLRAAGFAAPPFQRLERPDGSVALVQTVRDLPLVSIRGDLGCPSTQVGGSELLAALIEARFGQNGAPDLDLRVTSTPSHLLLEGLTTASRLTEWISDLAQALSPRPIGEDEFLALKKALTSKLTRASSPQSEAFQRWRDLLYAPGHPWGRSVQQLTEGIARMKAGELSELLKQEQLSGLTLAMSGDLTAKEATRSLDHSMPIQTRTARNAATPMPAVERTYPDPVRIHSGTAGSLILFGRLGPSHQDPDFYAFNLLSQILGGDAVGSRLARHLLDRDNRVSAVSCRLQAGLGPMPWLVSARPLPGETDATLQAIKEEVHKLVASPPTADEIERAVDILEGELSVSQASGAGRAEGLRNLELFHLSDDYLQNYAGAYRAIKPEKLREVARRWFGSDNYATVMLEP